MIKGYKINYKNMGMLLCVILLIVGIMYCVFQFLTSSSIVLNADTQEVEINSQVDYKAFIKEVKDGKISDVKINSKAVELGKLGEYTVEYHYNDEIVKMKIKVVDTKAPKVQLKSLKIAQNQALKAEELVEKVEDETQIKVSFAENYDFSKVGQLQVEVIVEDEGKNRTIEKTSVEVKKDSKAPVITANSFSVKKGEKVDLLKYALVRDDYDLEPKITVEKNDFDANKNGTYTIKYVAIDFSGNKSEKSVKVSVKDKVVEKVVYLTFDDGPSKYTSEVLSILRKYNCKASFFITGMNSSYFKYIKVAYDEGHTIGLHTYCHKYNKVYASVDAYFNDLDKIGALAKKYIGFVPKYIRFPGGSSNTVSRKYTKGIMTKLTKMVEEKGYQYYDWNAENGDGYSKMSKSEMIRRATSSSRDHVMILMHDANGKQNTVETLPTIIKYYQDRGYVFKAIDESTPVYHQHINN